MPSLPGVRPRWAGGHSGQAKRRSYSGRGASRSGVPYLALHPMGFSVPPRLRLERWALAPPFHPCPDSLRSPGGLSFCGTFRRNASRRRLPRVSRHHRQRRWRPVTRHRALWCSDFPPPAHAGRSGSDSPPFQNQGEYTRRAAIDKGFSVGGRPRPAGAGQAFDLPSRSFASTKPAASR